MPNKLFLGGLSKYAKNEDIEDAFRRVGPCKVDSRAEKGFAFVTFDSEADAERALIECKNVQFDGRAVNVEWAKSATVFRAPSHGTYRIRVSRLPRGCSWQDLKDHFKRYNPSFTEVDRRGGGVVDFRNYDDYKYALRRLDHSELETRDREYGRINCDPDERSDSESRSRSRSRSHRGHHSSHHHRSPSRSSSRSRSRSASPAASKPAEKPAEEKPAEAVTSEATHAEEGHKSPSKSGSRSRSGSKSVSRSRSGSKSGSHSRSGSKSGSHSRSGSKSGSHSRSGSRSRSKSSSPKPAPSE